MIFKIYDPPDGEKTWNELCVGAIVDFTSWEYEKFFCGAGTFELVIPIDAKGVESLKLNRFLATYGGQFIIKQLNYTAENVKVSGYDLNGLLIDRLTVAQTDNGKDKQNGYTETIVKHYVGANCVNSTSTDRNYPGLVIAEDKQRGISNDAASPRLQCVADVISDILSAQQMGWRISVPNFDNSGAAKMSFDVFNSKDRTNFETQEYKHVAFSYGLGNTANIKAEKSVAGAKNTLYCELSDGTVQTYSPIEDNVGYARTEEYADLNCELGDYKTYAEHEIADRFRETDSVTLEHIDPTKFGEDFDVGDIVTVYDSKSKITKAALITAAKIKRSEGEYDVTLTIGEARVKLLDRVSKSTKAVSKTVTTKSGESSETDRIKSGSSELVISKTNNYSLVSGIFNGNENFQLNISKYWYDGCGIRLLDNSIPKIMVSILKDGIKFYKVGGSHGSADFKICSYAIGEKSEDSDGYTLIGYIDFSSMCSLQLKYRLDTTNPNISRSAYSLWLATSSSKLKICELIDR